MRTALGPHELLDRLKSIERELGRTGGERWGPREIDLDLLLYGGEVLDEDALRVPHPEMTERAFVLVPLAEIAADAWVPGHGTVFELVASVAVTGVRLDGPLTSVA